MSLENDISCLYAAQHFAPHVQLEKPEVQEETEFIKQWRDILEKHGKLFFAEYEPHGQEFDEMEDMTKEQEAEAELFIQQLSKKTYDAIREEVTQTYEQHKTNGTLTENDERAYHEFLGTFTPDQVPMIGYGVIQQEAQQNLPPHEEEARRLMEERREQDNNKHENYLASAGINTEEGKIAWQIAHSAAYSFSSKIYFKEESEEQDRVQRPTTGRRRPPRETTLSQDELERITSQGVKAGLLSAEQYAPITNPDDFHEKARQWLSKEIQERLNKGLEFNLLDTVSVKKLGDGQIQLRLDKRKPY